MLKQPTEEDISKAIESITGLDLKGCFVNFELLLRNTDPDRYDKARAAFEAGVANHDNERAIRKRSYFGDSFGVHVYCIYPLSHVAEIRDDLKIHYPICTIEEIARIESPSNAEDQLLILRAEAIADSARLARVFMARRDRAGVEWSLTAHFDDSPFEEYLANLSGDLQERCRAIPAGTCFMREPNGICMKTPYGNLITVSETLRYYLYYMNAFLFDLEGVSWEDKFAALNIALRTMLLTESPDFDLDPRGRFPSDADRKINDVVDAQIQFVIGHEYAHHILGHLGEDSSTHNAIGMIPATAAQGKIEYYTPRQYQEFAADAGALLQASYSDYKLSEILHAATWFFLGLVLFEAVSDYISPSISWRKTHPDPVARIWALREKVLDGRSICVDESYSDDDVRELIFLVAKIKDDLIKEYIPFNIDDLERYGSVYLPSYTNDFGLDRVDF